MPPVNETNDQVHWKSDDGVLHDYSAGVVWDSIRPTGDVVNLFVVVWFSKCISHHAFLLWLVMGERLKTHDKMKRWEIHSSMILVCPLCQNCADSHDHLFFGCGFSSGVWSRAKHLFDIRVGNNWKDVVNVLTPVAARRCVSVVVTKIIFTATIYFIWQERNNRIFKKSHRT
ncbi:uncharacterized protein [Rutidosis leptorrhynchoides]|uniref:uncharacterized protein n=1 Tax=Rutidosis leptorrhynchoides TaxID=125765 RepID=UPI003A99FE96